MGREIKLTTHGLAFFVMMFMANLTCVEDQGTCDWICTSDTDIDKESRDMMAQEKLVKLKTLYEERVDRECANQTDVTNSSTFATLWLRMAANNDKHRKKLEGRLQFFTQTILEGIFSGQFAFGGYKETNVSCIFKSTSIKRSATNYSSRRLKLTFHTPQSTLYYVEHMTSYTKSNATFLTLLRTESNTRLSVGVTGANGSLASASSASDNELTVSDGWLFVSVIIWIVFLLYSPAVCILFQPSEVNLPLARRIQEARGEIPPKLRIPVESTEDNDGFIDEEIREGHVPKGDILPTPVQETEDDGGFIDKEVREGHGPPTENPENPYEDNELGPLQSDGGNSGAVDRLVRSEITGRFPEFVGSATTHPAVCFEETNKPSEEDSEMVVPLRRPYKSKVHKRRKLLGCCGTGNHNDLQQDLDFTSDSFAQDRGFAKNYRRLAGKSATRSYRSDKSSASVGTSYSAVTNRNDEELSGSVRNDEELVASNSNNDELNGFDRNDEELLNDSKSDHEELNGSDRNHEELRGSARNDGAEIVGSGSTAININEVSRQANDDAQQESSVQPFHEEEETEYICLIIVGETYPVGVGSCIGNMLFSTVNRNNVCNMVKLVFIFIVPLLFFTGLRDFFLVLLPNLHSRMAEHLPFPFLTSSVINGAISNPPPVLFLVFFSALCYFIRLSFVCFLSRNTLKTALGPCLVHRMHPTCITYKLLQCFLSELSLPKSICNFNRICSRQHLICLVCYWFYKTLLSYKSYKPCKDCKKPAPPECSKYLEMPQNISHNLEKQPDVVIKYWNSFSKCLSNFGETKSIACCLKVISFLLTVAPLTMDIIFSSPLVCLCHGRLWMLNERYKNKFKGSKFILPILEFLLIFFSLVWVIFFLLSSAVPLGVATIGLIKILATHTYIVLPHLAIAVIAVHYFWSCYRSFTTPYRDLAKILATTYRKKFDEQEKKPGINLLIRYKQGEEGNHIKVIPKELFNDGCKDLKLPIRNKVALLIWKLGLTLLVFLFVIPIISSDNVDPLHTTSVITFFAVAYNKINDAINGGKFEVSQEDADEVVDNYIRENRIRIKLFQHLKRNRK